MFNNSNNKSTMSTSTVFYTSKECNSKITMDWNSNSVIETILSFDYKLHQLDETRNFESVKNYFNYLEKLELPISAHNLIVFTIRNYELDTLTKKELLITLHEQ